jgi:8-oxo-dGTP diphosphatase
LAQREFPSNPLVGVGAVVVDQRGRVLLVKRGTEPRKGHWSIPGGLLELGETLFEGVRREIAEETGLSVKPEAVVEVVDRIYMSDGAESAPAAVRYHYVVVDYWCSVLSGDARPASDAADLVWVSRNEWLEPFETNRYALEAITVQVIEKGWQMALAAGIHG